MPKFIKVLLCVLLPVSICIVGFVTICFYSYVTYTPQYTATTEMMVVSSEGSQINVGDITTFRRVINSYVMWLSTDDFYQKVADESGLDLSPDVVGSMIEYTTDEDSEVFEVKVTSNSVETCKIISDSVETMIPRYLNSKYSRVAIHVLDSAGVPEVSKNNFILSGLLGGGAGAVIGACIAVGIIVISDVSMRKRKTNVG